MKKIIILCVFLLSVVLVKADLILPDSLVTSLRELTSENLPDLPPPIVVKPNIEQKNNVLKINNIYGNFNVVKVMDMSCHVIISKKIISDDEISISELNRGYYIVMVNNTSKRIYKN